jgi:hypothetical protein
METDCMKKITIPEDTSIGVSGKGDFVSLAIFLDEEPIELIFSLETIKAVVSILSEALLRKTIEDAA